MKIISVKFHNLNSLKGTHEIRLDKSPFIENGLFAITGPTGAGKTTILDAITVALYGRVSRHDPRSVEEIMTRHTGEAWSEVEFETAGNIYRAKWSVARSRGKADGNLQTPKRELAEKTSADTWEIIGGNKIKEVENKILELSGLDYDQFMRSVMLSQGDFTRFLKAGENERAELLEKITDTGIYSRISIFVYQQAKDKKTALENMRSRLGDVMLMTGEERENILAELADIKAAEQKEKEKREALTIHLQWLRNIEHKKLEAAATGNRLAAYKQDAEKQAQIFEQLSRHKKAVVHKPDLNSIKEATARIGSYSLQIADTGHRISQLEQELQDAAQHSKTAQARKEQAQKEWNETIPVIDQVLWMDEKINTEIKIVADQRQVNAQIEQELNEEAAKISRNKERKAQVEDEINKLSVWLKEHESEQHLPASIASLKALITNLHQVYEEGRKWKTEAESAVKQGEEKKQEQLRLSNEISGRKSEIETAIHLYNDLYARQATLLQEATIEQLEDEDKKLPLLVKDYGELYGLSVKYNTLGTGIADLAEKEQQYTKALGEENALLEQLLEREKQAHESLKDKRDLAEQELLIKKYEDDRLKLIDGEPCFLCGSTHHPYVAEHRASELSERQLRLQEQEIVVNDLNNRVRKKQQEIAAITGDLKSNRAKLDGAYKDKEDTLAKFNSINGNLQRSLAIDNMALLHVQIDTTKARLAEVKDVLGNCKAIAQQLREIESIKGNAEKRLIEIEGAYNGVTQLIGNLERNAEKAAEEMEKLKNRRDDYTKEAQQITDTCNIQFDYREHDAIISDLQNRQVGYIKNEQSLRETENALVTLEAELKNGEGIVASLTQKRDEEQKKLEATQNELSRLQKERQDTFGEKHPLKERERLAKVLGDYTQQLQEIVNKCIRLESDLKYQSGYKDQKEKEKINEEQAIKEKETILINKILKSGFNSLAHLESELMSEQDAHHVEQNEKALKQNIHSATEALQRIQTQLEEEQAKNLTTETPEQLTALMSDAEESIRNLNQQIGNITNRLQNDEEQKEKHSSLNAEIELQKKETDRWGKLSDLIGSSKGDSFRKFAQGLTLQRLTELANKHLEKLNDRYTLQKSDDKDLELKIIDTYQADIARPVNTLSGGESFLVSLALALGLSDMAGHKAQINSLFIDEGFGTLDADALDIAITTLENLQSRGKTIAVISHIEALKERISTQIQVRKLPGGYSSLKIVSGPAAFA